jgi:hypothetical protein
MHVPNSSSCAKGEYLSNADKSAEICYSLEDFKVIKRDKICQFFSCCRKKCQKCLNYSKVKKHENTTEKLDDGRSY